ncbi:MAG TPA: hypothetical protein VMU84_12000 [Thermoanaerobaculia bacterium]|nr:hypothetical protein [Thermoanaerobaculia bacterium]
MDRTTRAVYRLWGSLGENGELHATPRFQDELAELCKGKLDLCIPSVSKWSYGRQVEHLYRASHWTLDRLDESLTGANSEESANLLGGGFLTINHIPRHLFPTIPPLETHGGTMELIQPLKDNLAMRLARMHWTLDDVLASRGRSRHPRMRYLLTGWWVRFMDVHHRHHNRIIRDIVRADEHVQESSLTVPT